MFNKTSDDLHHRSKERIMILGEVFTPEKYVQDMLDLLDNKVWSDENTSFFEPCCGNGNIVIAIINRRMQAMYKKFAKRSKDTAALGAIAHTINSIWAIDIDAKNVNECRTRIFHSVIAFMKKTLDLELQDIIKIHKKFFVHVTCAIYWHIRENETLSSISSTKTAESNAQKTKMGYKWFKKNGHKPLDLSLSWVNYFIQHQNKNSIPIIYERIIKTFDDVIAHKKTTVDEFDFIHVVLTHDNNLTVNCGIKVRNKL